MKNGLSVSGLSEFVNEARAKPDEARARYGVRLNWETGMRSAVEAAPMNLGPHRVSRAFSWKADQPRQLLGSNHAPSPQEYLLSGLGACLMSTFVAGAAARDAQIEALEVEVEGDLDLRGAMGLQSDAPVGFSEIRYRMRVTGAATPAEFEELRRLAEAHSPNAATLKKAVTLKGVIEVVSD